MPENTVYVGRPTKWGNPYKVADYARDAALAEYTSWLERRVKENPQFLKPLIGKNLACWCPLSLPCHADILLKIIDAKAA